MTRAPITAILASRNDASLLERCLPAIRFCDEILVIDLESSDDTAAVATRHGATVVPYAYVPIAEQARVAVAERARHDWVLIVDPDEEIPAALAAELAERATSAGGAVGAVHAPIQYYAGGRPLEGTVWGGLREGLVMARRSAIQFRPDVHRGRGVELQPGYETLTIPFRGGNAVAHLWLNGYGSLLAKHRRYVRLEAAERFARGETVGVRTILRTPWRSFSECFLQRKGYRDGLTGLALSVLWAWYSTSWRLALRRRMHAGART